MCVCSVGYFLHHSNSFSFCWSNVDLCGAFWVCWCVLLERVCVFPVSIGFYLCVYGCFPASIGAFLFNFHYGSSQWLLETTLILRRLLALLLMYLFICHGVFQNRSWDVDRRMLSVHGRLRPIHYGDQQLTLLPICSRVWYWCLFPPYCTNLNNDLYISPLLPWGIEWLI